MHPFILKFIRLSKNRKMVTGSSARCPRPHFAPSASSMATKKCWTLLSTKKCWRKVALTAAAVVWVLLLHPAGFAFGASASEQVLHGYEMLLRPAFENVCQHPIRKPITDPDPFVLCADGRVADETLHDHSKFEKNMKFEGGEVAQIVGAQEQHMVKQPCIALSFGVGDPESWEQSQWYERVALEQLGCFVFSFDPAYSAQVWYDAGAAVGASGDVRDAEVLQVAGVELDALDAPDASPVRAHPRHFFFPVGVKAGRSSPSSTDSSGVVEEHDYDAEIDELLRLARFDHNYRANKGTKDEKFKAASEMRFVSLDTVDKLIRRVLNLRMSDEAPLSIEMLRMDIEGHEWPILAELFGGGGGKRKNATSSENCTSSRSCSTEMPQWTVEQLLLEVHLEGAPADVEQPPSAPPTPSGQELEPLEDEQDPAARRKQLQMRVESGLLLRIQRQYRAFYVGRNPGVTGWVSYNRPIAHPKYGYARPWYMTKCHELGLVRRESSSRPPRGGLASSSSSTTKPKMRLVLHAEARPSGLGNRLGLLLSLATIGYAMGAAEVVTFFTSDKETKQLAGGEKNIHYSCRRGEQKKVGEGEGGENSAGASCTYGYDGDFLFGDHYSTSAKHKHGDHAADAQASSALLRLPSILTVLPSERSYYEWLLQMKTQGVVTSSTWLLQVPLLVSPTICTYVPEGVWEAWLRWAAQSLFPDPPVSRKEFLRLHYETVYSSRRPWTKEGGKARTANSHAARSLPPPSFAPSEVARRCKSRESPPRPESRNKEGQLHLREDVTTIQIVLHARGGDRREKAPLPKVGSARGGNKDQKELLLRHAINALLDRTTSARVRQVRLLFRVLSGDTDLQEGWREWLRAHLEEWARKRTIDDGDTRTSDQNIVFEVVGREDQERSDAAVEGCLLRDRLPRGAAGSEVENTARTVVDFLQLYDAHGILYLSSTATWSSFSVVAGLAGGAVMFFPTKNSDGYPWNLRRTANFGLPPGDGRVFLGAGESRQWANGVLQVADAEILSDVGAATPDIDEKAGGVVAEEVDAGGVAEKVDAGGAAEKVDAGGVAPIALLQHLREALGEPSASQHRGLQASAGGPRPAQTTAVNVLSSLLTQTNTVFRARVMLDKRPLVLLAVHKYNENNVGGYGHWGPLTAAQHTEEKYAALAKYPHLVNVSSMLLPPWKQHLEQTNVFFGVARLLIAGLERKWFPKNFGSRNESASLVRSLSSTRTSDRAPAVTPAQIVGMTDWLQAVLKSVFKVAAAKERDAKTGYTTWFEKGWWAGSPTIPLGKLRILLRDVFRDAFNSDSHL